jgi:hypothetical protein
MEPLDFHTPPLLFLLIVPGFIAVKVYDLLVPSERRDWSSQLMEVMSYGTINFGLWFWALDSIAHAAVSSPWTYRLGMVLVLFVSPVLMGISAYGILSSRLLRRWIRHPTPTAWDHFFSLGADCWVVCHLKGGKVVAGRLTEDSFASTYPRRQDLYFGEAWEVAKSGRLLRPVADTAGVLVSMEDCEFLEFFGIGVRSVHG